MNEVNDLATATTRVAKEAEPRRRYVARDLELHDIRAKARGSRYRRKKKNRKPIAIETGVAAAELPDILRADQISHRPNIASIAGVSQAAQIPIVLDRRHHRIVVKGIVGAAGKRKSI
jgi:hypothetical protein